MSRAKRDSNGNTSTPAAQSALERLAAKRKERGASGAADWDTQDGNWMRHATAVVAARGGALRFGYTRDGGAYAIGIYLDGEQTTEYLKPTDNVTDWLATLVADLGDE